MTSDRLAAAQWARQILSVNPLILDTETTGLDGKAEVCQVAIINSDGATLLDTLVKPTYPIPVGATRIHGITDAMVKDAPTFKDLSIALGEILYRRTVIVYNADYDIRMLVQSHNFAGVQLTDYPSLAHWNCAMLWYAQFYGEWNEYRGDWRWQRLTDACYFEGIPAIDAPAHSALGDCLRTLAIVRKMAEAADEAVPT